MLEGEPSQAERPCVSFSPEPAGGRVPTSFGLQFPCKPVMSPEKFEYKGLTLIIDQNSKDQLFLG